MAKRSYRLDFLIDSSKAEASAKRVAAALAGSERAARAVAAAMGKAYSGAAPTAAAGAYQKVGTAAQQSAAVQAAANAKGMVGLDALRASAIKFGDAQRAAAETSTRAHRAAIEKQVIGVDRLRMSGIKVQDQLARAAEKGARAQQVAFEKQVVGVDQLRMSGIRMQDQLARAAERRQQQEDRLRARSLTDEQVAMRVRNRIVTDSNQRRVDEALRAAGVEQRTLGGIIAGHKNIVAGIVTAIAAQRVLTALGQAYAQAMKDAGDESRRRASQFTQSRETLGELASVRDRPLDNQFALEFARYNVKTGLKPEESLAFQLAFYGSGAQHIGPGRHISEEQGAKFKEMGGQFAAANRIDPRVVGDLAGQILASEDFSKGGDKAAEQALTKLNTVFQIGKRGRGANAELLGQFVKSAAVMLREDRAQGIMRSPEEVMTMISVMAERNPEDAEVYARRATEGLRAFKDQKAGPLLKKAKVTATDSPVEAARKLMPVLRETAQRRGPGYTDVDVLREHFDEREATGIATIIRGIEGGIFEDRAKYAEQFKRPGVAKTALDTFAASETGQAKTAAAAGQLAETERGAENSKLDILRSQAKAYMVKNKLIGTSDVRMKQWLMKKATFGMIDYSDEALIDLYASRMLNERIPGTQGDMPALPNNPEKREAMFRRHIRLAEGMGVDPLGGVAAAGGLNSLQGSLDKNTQALNQNNALMQQQNNRLPPIAPPAPPVLPPP